MEEDRAITMLREIQGSFNAYRHGQRLRQLRAVLEAHPQAYLVRCRDEKTGRRFGDAACRRGRCVKIGHTSWSPTYRGIPYQLWAVWEEMDMAALEAALSDTTPITLMLPRQPAERGTP
jgi:hypothetical protein